MRLTINGADRDVDADPNMPLLWVLRDLAGLTGTKFGCGMAQCGACAVHVDGAPQPSCMLPVSAAAGKTITTIDGMSPDGWHRRAIDPSVYAGTGVRSAIATAAS